MSAPKDPIDILVTVANNHYQAYLDSQFGRGLFLKELRQMQERSQQYAAGIGKPVTIDELDRDLLFISETDPLAAGARAEHQATYGWFKKRNAPGGMTDVFLGSMVLVSLYAFWEADLRAAVAHHLGVASRDIQSVVFGDMRLIRHSILHNAMVALPEIERCELLRWFKPGDPVFITGEHVDQMVVGIREFADELKKRTSRPST